jgi:hypothetical protein
MYLIKRDILLINITRLQRSVKMGFDFSVIKKYLGKGLVVIAATVMILGFSQRVEADVGDTEILNPNWSIDIDDFGYSDFLLDRRPGFEGREYLSGEWGAAVGYTKAGVIVKEPTWLTPNFRDPDWTTNSDFSVISFNASIGLNGDGFDIYQSTFGNADIEIVLTSQMINTVTGIAMGTDPASLGGAGSSKISDPYVFKQSYSITNKSGSDITDLKFYQLLHGLHSQDALYDDRNYGGAYGDYQFDTTLNGVSLGWNNITGEYGTHDDVLTMHTNTAPTGDEVGYYGIEGIDDHDSAKPSIGVHLSVEAGSLDGTDAFTPAELWVSGAQEHTLVDIADGETAIHDILLSINSADDILPWRPGEDFSNPILPDDVGVGLDGEDAWVFWFGAPDGKMTFIDPEVAIGYDYYHGDPFNIAFDLEGMPYSPYNSEQNFQSVLLPDMGDGLYDLYLFDTLTDEWVFEAIVKAGVEYYFGLGGVDRFRILGIEESAGLDPTDPTVFITGLTLVIPGTIEVTMQSITAATVPEPSTYLLLGSGIAGLIVWRRRRKG